MSQRRAMTPARKTRILAAHDGKCWRCGEPFAEGEPVEYDHKLALARGGTDDDENIGPAHAECHALKTFGTKARRLGSDIYEIAKEKRLRCGKKASKSKIQSRGFDRRYKRKLDGTMEVRR